MLDYLKNLDTQIFLSLNSFHTPLWDTIMWYVSGKLIWIPLYLGMLVYIIKKYKASCILPLLSIALVILLSDQIASGIIKPLAERLRPSHEPSLQGMVHIVNNYTGGKFGFASSHASNTFGLAFITLLLFRNKWYTFSIIFWAILVSYSRIYLGVHYPGDILAGVLIGIFSAFFIYWLYKKVNQKTEKTSA